MSLVKSVSSVNSTKSASSTIAAQELAAQLIILYIACFAYFPLVLFIIIIIIIIIIVIIIIIIPFFVILLNCLYSNPQVLLFVRSSLHPTAGGEASEQLHGSGSQLPN